MKIGREKIESLATDSEINTVVSYYFLDLILAFFDICRLFSDINRYLRSITR